LEPPRRKRLGVLGIEYNRIGVLGIPEMTAFLTLVEVLDALAEGLDAPWLSLKRWLSPPERASVLLASSGD
jgi:hypothetical protein